MRELQSVIDKIDTNAPHGNRKLSDQEVQIIRDTYGSIPTNSIAEYFKISRQTVHAVRHGLTYSDVKNADGTDYIFKSIRLSDESKHDIVSRRLSGESASSIAGAYGISSTYVRTLVRNAKSESQSVSTN